MKITNYKDKVLIRRSRLRMVLKDAGIISANEDALILLEKFGQDIYEKIARALKEKLVIKGRKVLGKEEVEAVLREL